MPGCAKCGRSLDIVGNQVGRRDTCSYCGAELRACIQCRHFDPIAAKQCREPFAEVPSDRESGNFCDFFQVGEGGLAAKTNHAAVHDAAEALFRKRP